MGYWVVLFRVYPLGRGDNEWTFYNIYEKQHQAWNSANRVLKEGKYIGVDGLVRGVSEARVCEVKHHLERVVTVEVKEDTQDGNS